MNATSDAQDSPNTFLKVTSAQGLDAIYGTVGK